MRKERSGISELLEIVFHYILYAKRIYPAQIFEKRIRCNLPIWKCKYPPVCSYISNFFVFLEKLLGEEPLDVAFLVIGKSGEILEEFVFEILYPKDADNSKPPIKFRLEELLSCIALALSSISSSKSNCRGSSFQLQVRSNCSKVSIEDIKDDLKNEKFPWTATENPETEPWSKIIPLQTVDNSRFKGNLVEQFGRKRFSKMQFCLETLHMVLILQSALRGITSVSVIGGHQERQIFALDSFISLDDFLTLTRS